MNELFLPPILNFKDDPAHHFLSNMWACSCPHAGYTFRSSEHLYQWLKVVPSWWQDQIMWAESGQVAKKLSKNEKCPKVSQDPLYKLACMNTALRSKFENNAQEREWLIETHPRELVEGNWWNDTFWGVCNGEGTNNLGKMLMRLREEYRNAAHP